MRRAGMMLWLRCINVLGRQSDAQSKKRMSRWNTTCLREVPRLEPWRCLGVLGAPVHVDGRLGREYQTIVATAWSAFHSKRALCVVAGHLHAKFRAARLGVPDTALECTGFKVYRRCSCARL